MIRARCNADVRTVFLVGHDSEFLPVLWCDFVLCVLCRFHLLAFFSVIELCNAEFGLWCFYLYVLVALTAYLSAVDVVSHGGRRYLCKPGCFALCAEGYAFISLCVDG